MKLLFAIVQNDDVKQLNRALLKHEIYVTRISSSGGFLSGGNTTLMIGVEEEKLQETLDVIAKHSQCRTMAVPAPLFSSAQIAESAIPVVNVTIGGATVFVVNVENFYKF